MRRFWTVSSRALLLGVTAVGLLQAVAHAEEDSKKSKKEEAPQIDYIDLAARMIHGKHFDRALKVLSEADPADPALDKKRFYLLRGISHLHQGHNEEARDDLKKTISAGSKEPEVQVYLAQAQYKLKAYGATLEALKKAGKVGKSETALYSMRAHCEWELKKPAAAVTTLEEGSKRFPTEAGLQRARIFYLIELGLYLEAVTLSDAYLARADIKEDDYVAIGEALRAAKQYKKAQAILEGARLRFPESEKVLLQLAHSYLDAQRRVAGAMLFEDAARLNPKFTVEAAELYKEAGMVHRAMRLNARVADQKAKAKQRLALVLAAENFESVTAMLPKLQRLGLTSEDNIRYALAYAFFKTQRFEQAEALLKQVTSPDVFESSLQLRKAMENCRAAGWECTL